MNKFLPLVIAALCAVLPFPLSAQNNFGTPSRIVTNAGAPVNGTSEIQTITFGGTITGGTFKLVFQGKRTAAITWSSTNATLVSHIDSALEALPNVGTGGVTTAEGTMTSGIGTITVTFGGNNAKLNVQQMTVESSLTGTSPTVAVTTTTPGVDATARGSTKGTLLVDTDTPGLYQNTGTAVAPSWDIVPTDATVATLTGTEELTNKTVTGGVIKNGLTASGSTANNFSGSTGTFLTATGLNTFGGKAALKVIATPVAAAGAGGGVSGAAQLGSANIVTISSDGATKGVKLQTGVAGDVVWVINTSATAANLFAASGGTINGGSANAGCAVPASKGVLCICTAADTWFVFDFAAHAGAAA